MDKIIDQPPTDISMNSFAEISCNGNKALTAISSKGDFVKINLASAAFMMSMLNFSFSDNRLIYQGANGNFNMNLLALIAHNGEAIARELRVTIYKNGSPVNESFGKVSSSGTILFKPAGFVSDLVLSNGDYLEAMVCNAEGTESLIVQNLKLSVTYKQ